MTYRFAVCRAFKRGVYLLRARYVFLYVVFGYVWLGTVYEDCGLVFRRAGET